MSDTHGFKLKEHTKSSGIWTFTIENFSKYNLIDKQLTSPDFSLADSHMCYLSIHLHETKRNNILLYLCCQKLKNFVESPRLKYKLSIISTNRESIIETEGYYDNPSSNGWVRLNFVEKAELFANKDLYLPNDTLTISCELTRSSEKPFGSALIVIPESQNVEILRSLAEHRGFGDVITLRFFNKGSKVIKNNPTMPSSMTTRSSAKLSTKKQKTNKEINENTVDGLEVKDFQVYKGILTSHSPVFEAIFRHKETKENQENLIEINDVDPQVGDDMLYFLYHDELRISENNLIGLLAAADKYQLMRLKALCEEALFNALTKENSLITLSNADFYNANQLKEAIFDFIVEHIDDVRKSDGFTLFKKQYPLLTLELIEKAFDRKK